MSDSDSETAGPKVQKDAEGNSYFMVGVAFKEQLPFRTCRF